MSEDKEKAIKAHRTSLRRTMAVCLAIAKENIKLVDSDDLMKELGITPEELEAT